MGNRDTNRAVKRKFPTKTMQPVEPRHCDEYIEDSNAPQVLRTFLARAREPGHGHLNPAPYPTLYADYKGSPVRVTMASRLGDVGISYNLDADSGYSTRVPVAELDNFREKP